MGQKFYNNSIFYIEVDKIKSNPYQPRREFNEQKLAELGDSIRQYGVLQPIVVTRMEYEKEEGGLGVEYELIAGERRLRASKLAGLSQIPAVIRSGENDDRMKLELAIIENLQREDLNPIDRAYAFKKLAQDFGFKHIQIAKKIGKSREYVSNSIRLLMLPQDIIDALIAKEITEGHTRPLLMLIDRPAEQITLFKEIMAKRLTVREAESISRRIAYDKIRKKDIAIDPEIVEIEEQLTDALGTRVQVDIKDIGGKIMIDFFSNDDLWKILNTIKDKIDIKNISQDNLQIEVSKITEVNSTTELNPLQIETKTDEKVISGEKVETKNIEDDDDEGGNEDEIKSGDDDLYSVKNFSV